MQKLSSSEHIDGKLISMLKDLPYFSVLNTSIRLRLADYAAALCGCRSSRQVPSCNASDVSDNYNELMNALQTNIYECLNRLDDVHNYKNSIIEMSDDKLEILLENTLYEMTVNRSNELFTNTFFE